MCGVMYLKRNDVHSPVKPLLTRYEEQRSRGTQGFGFVAVKDGKIIGYERSVDEAGFKSNLEKYHHASEILAHHRLPTSTKNLEETAHPIFVSNKILNSDYYVIHNGVITNDDKLKAEHEAMGFEYNTEVELFAGYKQKHGKKKKKQRVEVTKTEFNDSEALAIEFALFNEGIKKEMETVGSATIIAYEVDKKTQMVKKLHYARNDNPLKAYRCHGMFVLSSQSTDQGHTDVESYKLISIDYKTQETSIKPMRLDASSFSKQGASGWSSSQHTSDYRYPSYSVHTPGTIGFDTTRTSLADDVDDEDKKTVALLQDGTPKSLIGTCVHGFLFSDTCQRCLSVDTVKKLYAPRCDRTSDYIHSCYCKKHRKETKRLKKLEKDKGNILSPYQEDIQEPDVCPVCSEHIVGSKYLDKKSNQWTHFECQSDTVAKRKVVKVDGVFKTRLEKKAENFEQEIARLENVIDNLEQQVHALEEDGMSTDMWVAKSTELESAKKELEKQERDSRRLFNFMSGIPF